MAEFTIGQIAERSGIAASAIRFYESEGLLPKPLRRGGWRVYDETVLDRLALLELAKGAGFRVAEIRQLLAGFKGRTPPGERWRKLTRAKLVELDARIAEAERMKAVLRSVTRCACPTLEDCGRALRRQRSRER